MDVSNLKEFKYRDYQIEPSHVIEKDGIRRMILVWARRMGKDFWAIRTALRMALQRVGTIAYIFPTFNMARGALWHGISIGGVRILDYIPDEICTKNSSEMRVTLLNGSQIQFFGSDNFNRLRGKNFMGCIFSEYAYQDPRAFDVVSPMLAANKGWAIFASTPNGKNHFYDLYNDALKNPERWYTSLLTVEDAKHVEPEELEQERKRLSEDMFQQEYMCSFAVGVEGSVYSHYINKMYLEHRIGEVLYDPSFPVHTAWDIGVRDSDTTVIIFFQVIGNAVHIIDSYENFRKGSEHYVKFIKSKSYSYGKHCLPHDVKVFEWGSGLERTEQLENLGLEIERIPRIKRKIHGIEKVRTVLPRMHIDEKNNEKLIKALNIYHYKWDKDKARYLDHEPVHDWSSNFCDGIMYVCTSLSFLKTDYTAEELQEMNRSALNSSLGPRSYGTY